MVSPRKRKLAKSGEPSPSVDTEEEEITFKVPPKPQRPQPGSPGAPPPRRSPNGFLLPDPLPPGFVCTDTRKEKWVVGAVLGTGGFGEIYEAKGVDQAPDEEDYVVKVEPHSNGPLFVELAFFLRAAKKELLVDFKEKRHLEHLGVPQFRASGSYTLHGKKFRFLVMPRYGADLQTIMDKANKGSHFSNKTAAAMALQVLDSLEYIHSRGYIHKDIKGSNLLMGRKGQQQNIFLVDFGLCSRYTQHGMHRPYCPDRRWAHEGTLEYTSRDCHRGCFSRRGDMEVLFYNMVEWLGGRLPWEDMAESDPPPKIHQVKIESFENPDRFLADCFKGRGKAPGFLRKMMVSVQKLRFEEEPNYQYLRCLFSSEVYNSSVTLDEVSLNIEMISPKKKSRRNSVSDESDQSSDSNDKENEMPSSQNGFEAPPPLSKTETDKLKESANFVIEEEEESSEEVKSEESQEQGGSRGHISESSYERARKAAVRDNNERSLLNPTPAMREQMLKLASRRGREGTPVNARTRRAQSSRWKNLTPSSLTPAMKAVMDQRAKKQRGSPRKRKLTDDEEEDNEVTFVSPSRKRLKFDGIAPPKPSSPTKARRTTSSLRKTPNNNGLTRNQAMPYLRRPGSGDVSPSLSSQVSQAMGAGFGFIMGVSRRLMTSFSGKREN